MIGRAAEKSVGDLGNLAMGLGPFPQVITVLGQNVVGRIALAVLYESHAFMVGRIGFHIIDLGGGLGGVAEGGVGGDIVDPLPADINHAAIAQTFQMLFSCA